MKVKYVQMKIGEVYSLENRYYTKTIEGILTVSQTKDMNVATPSNMSFAEIVNYEFEEVKQLPKLTDNEIAILKSVYKKWEWIAMDKNGDIWLYESEPVVGDHKCQWFSIDDCYDFTAFEHLFQGIEPMECWKISELIGD